MLKNLFVAAAVLFLSMTASAHDGQPAWVCKMAFKGESQGAQIIVGHFHTEATGRIKCVGLNGDKYSRDVKISMGTSPISAAIGLGDFEFAGRSAEISLVNCHPDALLGTYLVAEGQVAVIGGAGAFAAAKIDPPQIAVQISMQLLEGFGVQLGFHRMTIAPLN